MCSTSVPIRVLSTTSSVATTRSLTLTSLYTATTSSSEVGILANGALPKHVTAASGANSSALDEHAMKELKRLRYDAGWGIVPEPKRSWESGGREGLLEGCIFLGGDASRAAGSVQGIGGRSMHFAAVFLEEKITDAERVTVAGGKASDGHKISFKKRTTDAEG
eukprot:1146574-Pelagomonas_calceolata.AAC.3